MTSKTMLRMLMKSKYNGDNKKDAISDVFQVETGTNNFDSFLKLTILTGHYL